MGPMEIDRISSDYQSRHAAFVAARRTLVAAGVPPRLASALASVGVRDLDDLRRQRWTGRKGLRAKLESQRLVGPSTLQAAAEWIT